MVIPASLFISEHILSHRVRHKVMLVADAGLVVALALAALGFYYGSDVVFNKALGAAFVVFAVRIVFFAYESYFRSYFFRVPAGEFEYARLMRDVEGGTHPLRVFLESKAGADIMERAGIPEKEYKAFAAGTEGYDGRYQDVFTAPRETLSSWVGTLVDTHKPFKDFLFTHKVRKEDMLAVTRWRMRIRDASREREWWWSRSNLARFRGLGIEWAYPETWTLDKYSRDISSAGVSWRPAVYMHRRDIVEQISSILGRAREANVMLVGPPGVGKKETIRTLSYFVATCQFAPRLCLMRVVLLNPLLIISAAKEKGIFEERFRKILADAARAGNVILVIDNFPEFTASARELGADVPPIVEEFLRSDMPVLALSDEYKYHQIVEGEQGLMSYFEVVRIEEPDEETLRAIIEETASFFEVRNGLYFTYRALQEVEESAKRYLTEGIMPEKAIDLVGGVASWALRERRTYLTDSEVLAVVKEKTAIPVGEISEEEKSKLLHLEDILHRRVVGQNEAVVAVSDALRRARADIEKTTRPMGTFLFLGPTGVGKTETAKALAGAFFGGEEHMMRLDMSEYAGEDALERLIGSYERGKPGVFATLLRSHPYGVVLLDEFEKASRDVHNLFLQIFDEGFFSDMNGQRVNARNVIFIATSNAGSDVIFEAVEKGARLTDEKERIVRMLIKNGAFRPELLNRFDAVVLFHPLGREHIEKVAVLGLEALARRLEERNIHLVITKDLVEAAVRYGYDPKFGAREMQRAIQDKIEKIIARKIITGDVAEGSDLVLSRADLALSELGV